MFEKIMYKVKDNTFRVRDLTKKDNVDESKFVEDVNQKGNKQLKAQVYVLFEDEYQELLHDVQDALSTIELKENIIKDKQKQLNEKESEIKRLNKEIKDNEHSNIDEVLQLKEDISTMKEDHQKEVSQLRQKVHDLEKTHLEDINKHDNEHANEILELTKTHQDEITHLNEDISSLKQEHLEKLNEKEQSHNDEREQIRNTFLNLLVNENKEDVRQLIELEDNVPSIFRPFMRKHLKAIDEMKEKKQVSSPEKIVKTYELSGKKEKE